MHPASSSAPCHPQNRGGQLNTSVCRRGNQGTERNLSLLAAEPGQGLRPLASPSRAPPSSPPKKHGRQKGQGHLQDSESSESAFFLCPGGREKQEEVYKERKRTRKAQEILILTDRFSEFGRSYRAPLTPLQRQECAGPGPTSTHVSPSHQVCSNPKHLT